jgi:hypothetical protein
MPCAEARSNEKAKKGLLGAYVNQVQAQSGKSLLHGRAAILITLAHALWKETRSLACSLPDI